jgi:beta-N-acetylhexosaminidase
VILPSASGVRHGAPPRTRRSGRGVGLHDAGNLSDMIRLLRRAAPWALGVALVALTGPAPAGAQVALSPEQLAGQRVVYAFQGTSPPPGLVARIRRGEAGAVILFGGNVASADRARRLIARMQAIPRPRGLRAPLIVSVDQEGGAVTRLPGGPDVSAAEVGESGDEAEAEAMGRTAGRALVDVGANVNLAPVADVPRAGSVIERQDRAFGRDPDLVARMSAAYLDGLWLAGVAGAAKHFPGLGPAPVSTDDAPVTVGVESGELRAFDGRPYRLLIERGVPLVMLATAIYPALDDLPAALSPAIVQDELRQGYGFGGVTVSDALDTPALAPHGTEAQTAVAAAAAGTDLLIYAGGYPVGDRAAAGVAAALRSAGLSTDEAERALGRVMALRFALAQPGGLQGLGAGDDGWATMQAGRALTGLAW